MKSQVKYKQNVRGTKWGGVLKLRLNLQSDGDGLSLGRQMDFFFKLLRSEMGMLKVHEIDVGNAFSRND